MAAQSRLAQNKEALPLYGSVVGVLLPFDHVTIVNGIELRRGIFETFSAPMMAFNEAPANSHTPGPWVAIDGGYHSFKARVELCIANLSALDGFTPSQAVWLFAALLRLRVEAPIRITAVANVPLGSLAARDIWPLTFEAAPYQNGLFRASHLELSRDDIDWLSQTLPVAARFCHQERFLRALSIFDESVWSGRLELGAILIWTAIEILFDCSAEQHKTKAICSALADNVGHDKADRDRAYDVISELYRKRGGIVHGGSKIERHEFGQSYALARAAFLNVLGRKELPQSKAQAL
jgi:hypothetical protein